MKSHPQKPAKPELTRPSDSKPERKNRQPLSKTLPGGKNEPPGDRGACEKQTPTQGSE